MMTITSPYPKNDTKLTPTRCKMMATPAKYGDQKAARENP
jgi:hypothetical protein